MGNGQDPRPRWRERLEEVAPWLEFIGVTGIVLYALGRWAVERFFDTYGVDIEETGLSETALLWPVAASLGLFLAALLVVAEVVFRLSSWDGRKRWLLLGPLLIAIGWHLFIVQRDDSSFARQSFAWCLSYGGLLGIYRAERIEFAKRRGRALPRAATFAQILSALIIPIAWSSFIPWIHLPDELRLQIVLKQEASTQSLPFPPSTIQFVRVHATAPDNPLPAVDDQCLHLFGSAGGVTVLYDSDTKTTWRIPSSHLSLQDPCTGQCTDTSRTVTAEVEALLEDRSRYQVAASKSRHIGPGSGDAYNRELVATVVEDKAGGSFQFARWLVEHRYGSPDDVIPLDGYGEQLTNITRFSRYIDGEDRVYSCFPEA
jgi:hypothetical protein